MSGLKAEGAVHQVVNQTTLRDMNQPPTSGGGWGSNRLDESTQLGSLAFYIFNLDFYSDRYPFLRDS